jgi:hypothetical protein
MRPDCYIRAKRGHSGGNGRAKIARRKGWMIAAVRSEKSFELS